MKNLLLLLVIEEFVPIIIGFIFFIVIFITVISKGISSAKKGQEELIRQHQQQSQQMQSQSNGLTAEQIRYLSQLRDKQRQTSRTSSTATPVRSSITPTVSSSIGDHSHVGQTEQYEEIVGSLGDVSDEGCDELSGIRLIAHDLAYAPEAKDRVDYDRVARAMILGEVLNTPRYKVPYISKRK